MKNNFGLFVCGDDEKCTGCRACELACFTVHNRSTNNVGYTAGTVEVPVTQRLYLTHIENSCIPILCKHCENPPCKAVCKQNAIYHVDGLVVVNEEKCIGCKDCLMACPFGAVTLLPLYRKQKPVLLPDTQDNQVSASKCDLCSTREEGPACIQVCPHNALRLVDVEEERKLKNISTAQGLAIIHSN